MNALPALALPVPPPASAAAPAGAHPSPARAAWPSWRDPRWPFAALLTSYAILGLTVLGFNRSPGQMALVVVAGTALDLVLTRVLRGIWQAPLSAYITCCSLALLLNYAHGSALLLLPVVLAIGSKHLLTFAGRHVFNPSMFGVALSLLLSRELITAAPAYQWVGGAGAGVVLSALIVMAACLIFIGRVGRLPLVLTFLGLYTLQTALRAHVMRHHLPPETLFLGTLTAPSFFIFTFYMLTDPATSPRGRRGQMLLAAAITLVDLVLHLRQSVYTFFYASLICASARFLFLHGRATWAAHGRNLRQLTQRAFLLRLAWVGGVGGLFVAGLALADGGPLGRDLGFRMTRLDPAQTGVHSQMGHLFDEVDPRLQHVAKWLLSVGDAVATGDVDGDGRLDLFFTSPLKAREQWGLWYRNLGDLRWEPRVLAPVAEIAQRFPALGVPSGAAFVDYDGDGDQDLLLAMSFGPARILRNLRRETGRLDFVDATAQLGNVAEPCVSLAVTALDFDRDGVLDLLVTNAASPWLRDYPTPTPLNIFALPRAQYPGDRRMFHFMHNGWHNADNGGGNRLYRGHRDGHFERLDAAAVGMPQTHWSLAVGTADLNRDGFTDLYLANDFGPDDVYLNRAGRGFEHIQGGTFGAIGRDTYKGMNVSIADFDRNGWLDVYVSNVHHPLQAEGSLLWMLSPGPRGAVGLAVPRFSDEAAARGALNERRFGWGAAAGDLDLDGWPDLVQGNGMVDDRLDHLYERDTDYWYVSHKLMQSGPEIHTYADRWGDLRGRTIYPNEPRRAYLNRGAGGPGEFVDVAAEIGIAEPDNSRGVLLADLDNDGDLDLVVTNQHGAPSFYRNSRRGAGAGPGFIGLTLVGDGLHTSRAALGTRVELRYSEGGKPIEQVRELGLMAGFSAQADPRLLFGLGRHLGQVEVTIHWYGAAPQTLTLAPGRYHEVHQDGAPL